MERHYAQVCISGHVITDTTKYGPTYQYCPTCGSRTIERCEACGGEIPGQSPLAGGDYRLPAYCVACGTMYPWTASAKQSAEDLIDLLDGLDDKDKDQLKGTLDDLMSDSDRTEVAAMRFKLLAKRAGSEGGTALRAIITSVATEAAKRAILGP